jgi:hypothetical protein
MNNNTVQLQEITPEIFTNLLAHFRALTQTVQEMQFYQSCYFKNRDKKTLAKAKKLELATKKIVGYCLSLEKVINIDTNTKTNELIDLSMCSGL